MSDRPRQESEKYRYGQWAGEPKGCPQDLSRCVYEVARHRGWGFGQCSRPRGNGYGGLYCKQHAAMYPAAEPNERGDE